MCKLPCDDSRPRRMSIASKLDWLRIHRQICAAPPILVPSRHRPAKTNRLLPRLRHWLGIADVLASAARSSNRGRRGDPAGGRSRCEPRPSRDPQADRAVRLHRSPARRGSIGDLAAIRAAVSQAFHQRVGWVELLRNPSAPGVPGNVMGIASAFAHRATADRSACLKSYGGQVRLLKELRRTSPRCLESYGGQVRLA